LRHDAGLFSLERVEPELIRLSSQFDLGAEFHNTFGRDLKVVSRADGVTRHKGE
jgi:hypothetical protein